MTPIVSIVLPTYNRAQLLDRAINSVLNQSFTNWELIVVDDASTDNTKDILDEWQKKDERIKVIRNDENIAGQNGICKNLNRGIEMSKGKYIARIDDDDRWTDKDKLKKQIDFLETNSDYVLCGGGAIVVDNEGRELFRYLKNSADTDIRKKMLFANPFSHSTVVFLKDAAKKVGYYGLLHYAEDWDLWLKIGKIGKMYNFPEYFSFYLMADQGGSFIYQKEQSKIILNIIKNHKNDYPNFYLAYCLNFSQYLYSLLPIFIRKLIHPILSNLKRSI